MKNLKENYIKFINGLTKWFLVLFPTMIVSIFMGADLIDSYTTNKYMKHEMIERFPFALGLCYILTFVVTFLILVILNRYVKIFVLSDDNSDDIRHYPKKSTCILGIIVFILSIPIFYNLNEKYEIENNKMIASELLRLQDTIKSGHCISHRKVDVIDNCIEDGFKIPGIVAYETGIVDKESVPPIKNIITYRGFYYAPFCRAVLDHSSEIEFKQHFTRILVNSEVVKPNTSIGDICMGNRGLIPEGVIQLEF